MKNNEELRMNNEEWRINIVKNGRGDSSVFFCDYSPLLLFNYYLLTQYVLLFFCLKKDIKKGNLPRLPIFINLKSNTMKNTMQR